MHTNNQQQQQQRNKSCCAAVNMFTIHVWQIIVLTLSKTKYTMHTTSTTVCSNNQVHVVHVR